MKYAAAITALLAALLFTVTAPPTIYFGDSGEIVSAAYTLGIAHPPGYPLFMLPAKIATALPLGDIAFRVNFLSILLSLAAFILIYMCGKEFLKLLDGNREDKMDVSFASLAVSAVYLFSSMFWFESIHAKGGIYVMMHLSAALAFYLLLKNISTGSMKYFYAAVYAAGFMAPVHNTISLLAAAFVMILFYTNRKKLKLPAIAGAAALFMLAAATPYLYLFIRTPASPAVNFMFLKDAGDVWAHITREVYAGRSGFDFSFAAAFERLKDYFIQFILKYNVLAALVVAGYFVIYNRSKKLFWAMLGLTIVNTAGLIYAINTSAGFTVNSLSAISMYASKNFYLSADMLAIFPAMAGMTALLDFLTLKYSMDKKFVSGLVACIPIFMIFVNFDINNHSSSFLALDHAENIFKTVKPGETVFARDDCPLFNMLYLRTVKGKYRDIKAYDRGVQLLDYDIYTGLKEKTFEAVSRIELETALNNPGRVFYTGLMEHREAGLRTKPYGIIYKMTTETDNTAPAIRLLQLYSIRDFYRNTNNDLYYRDVTARYFVARARHAAMYGDRPSADIMLKLAEKTAPESPEILNSIAMTYYYDLYDLQAAVDYVKKIINMNKYDYGAIRSLIELYKKLNPANALDWLKYYSTKITDETEKANVQAEIEGLKATLGK